MTVAQPCASIAIDRVRSAAEEDFERSKLALRGLSADESDDWHRAEFREVTGGRAPAADL